jgi:hypothetical protein
MTNKVYNRIIETSSNTPATSGTVTVNLSGTSPSLTFVGAGTAAGRKFVDKYANNDTCRVHIFETANPVRWVIADVTFNTGTPNTLTFVAANIKDGSAGAATIPSWAGSVTCAVEFGADYMQKLIGDREVLTAARTYYVRTDGSDSNDGLANTSGGAFLTLQKAIDVVCGPTLDFGGQTVTIQVGAGTYTSGTSVAAPWAGGGGLVVQGDVATPSNVVISSTGDCFAIAAVLPGVLNFRGFKVISSNFGIHHNGGGTLKLENIDFGACLFQLLVDANGAYCDASGTGLTFSGGATLGLVVNVGGVLSIQGTTVTMSGTPAYVAEFVLATRSGVIQADSGCTFSGSATGTRYAADGNGVIYTGGAGATFFPGNAAGSTSAGGQYL